MLAQTYDHALLELIIVNDQSSDNSVAIATQTLKDSAIRYEILDVRFGDPSLTRNYGWQHAESEWIQFLDADDLLHPDKIAHQAASSSTIGLQIAAAASIVKYFKGSEVQISISTREHTGVRITAWNTHVAGLMIQNGKQVTGKHDCR